MRTVMPLLGVLVAMGALVYYAVPLYRLFCQVTGYGGTVQRAAAAPGASGTRTFTVRFNADVNRDLPWSFRPVSREITVRVGEEKLAHYRARNRAAKPVTGTATFNVTPQKAGMYFVKVACFCFTKQRLEAGRSVDMPVSFYVDPAILKDPNLRDVRTITLSYTFYRAPGEDGKSAARRATAKTKRTRSN
jgi:cytochrome c oxidase assembly protein subunit 11